MYKIDYAKFNHTVFLRYSKAYLNQFKNDSDDKFNNNYLMPFIPSTTVLQMVSTHNHQKQEFQQDNGSINSQRKRHADDHSGEPRSKIIC